MRPLRPFARTARRWWAVLLGVPLVCYALTLRGRGTITPAEQAELESYIRYFGRASLTVREYCYFDEAGRPKNRGRCVAEVPRSPDYFAPQDAEYARQYRGEPLGPPVAEPEMEIVYLHSFPEVWLACNHPRAYGCTLMEEWPRRVTIFLTTFDKQLGDITLHHEIEYHARRGIRH
ncbi:MAG: hypothetical protein KatS3mg124_0188 [Porticoccaceae bacterium]|nr:MAG: hypothetical protein KatS3mg124_0188 [Porticoccaceae bacterium]